MVEERPNWRTGNNTPQASAPQASAPQASAPQGSVPEASAPEASAPGDDTADLSRMLDLATPWCLHVAATLRIPEHISVGRTGIAELAAAAGCDRDVLHAVLGHAGLEIVAARTQSSGRFVVEGRPAGPASQKEP
jgi:hypothetical protein